MKNTILSVIFLFVVLSAFSQHKKKSFLKPYKIGFLYNYGSNENFLFDDTDFTYSTNTYKGQLFYSLGTWKKIDFELIVQPQVQFSNHQLINKFYVTPNQENYLEKIAEFTQPKKMNLYGIEFGLAGLKKITEKIYIQGSVSLGLATINTRTERLAKGFTFLENFSLGFLFKNNKKSHFYLGTSFGHVSNLNFQKPNDGYNILGIDVGYSFLIN